MDFIELSVEAREKVGKSANRQLRDRGMVPAVLYGGPNKTMLLQINKLEIGKQLQNGNRNAIYRLLGAANNTTAIIKEVQKAKTKDVLLHLDFQRVAMDTEIETSIPIEFRGESIGIKSGGILQHNLREIQIKVLPKDMPEKFEIDISELDIGSAVKVSDIKKVKDVEILSNPEEVVVSIVPPTELKEEEPVEEVEDEEGEIAKEGEETPAEEPEETEEKS